MNSRISACGSAVAATRRVWAGAAGGWREQAPEMDTFVAAKDAFDFLGAPEGHLALAQAAVLVPAIAAYAGTGEFDEADAALDESTGEQAFGGERARLRKTGVKAV